MKKYKVEFSMIGLIILLMTYLVVFEYDSLVFIGESFVETFNLSTILIIVGFSSVITGITIWLVNKQVNEVSRLKHGDTIRYNGCDGTIKSIDRIRSVIEIDVPLMSLSKVD